MYYLAAHVAFFLIHRVLIHILALWPSVSTQLQDIIYDFMIPFNPIQMSLLGWYIQNWLNSSSTNKKSRIKYCVHVHHYIHNFFDNWLFSYWSDIIFNEFRNSRCIYSTKRLKTNFHTWDEMGRTVKGTKTKPIISKYDI